MKTLIVYDSLHGNTESIAKAIGAAIADEAKAVRVGQVDASELNQVDLLIVGSPTHGGRPTPEIQDFLKRLPESTVKDTKVAAFDTRVSAKWVKIFGFAAGKISGKLKKRGGILLLPPEGFIVKGTKGPLKEGELERAAAWAKAILESANQSSVSG